MAPFRARDEGETMSDDLDLDEPESLPEAIVHWQPNHHHVALTQTSGAVAKGASIVGLSAVTALALGAMAIGAVAIGALAIGRLNIGGAKLGRVEIDELIVRRLKVLER
jgi:hypothetical protein